MAKPICLIKADTRIFNDSFDIWKYQDMLQEKLPDYHIIALPILQIIEEPITLEVFYEKDFEEKDKDYIINFVKEKMKEYEQNKDESKTEVSY